MIPRRVLGRTGLSVSEIGLGTVQLGMPYGLPDANGNLPVLSEFEALEILRRAMEEGINFLDTARGYGNSEELIGKALKRAPDDVIVATKLSSLSELMTDEEMAKHIRQSIEDSRRALDREVIDLLQVHNATPAILKREVILDLLAHARHREWIRFQGITTYGLEAPETAIDQGYWDTIQLEFNVFNQSTRELFDEAKTHNIGLIVRSAMLKGAITTPLNAVPEDLKPIAQKAAELPAIFQRRALSLPQLALLFVLSHPQIATTLTGVLNTNQLLENIGATTVEHLLPEQLEEAKSLHINDPSLTDPRLWFFKG